MMHYCRIGIEHFLSFCLHVANILTEGFTFTVHVYVFVVIYIYIHEAYFFNIFYWVYFTVYDAGLSCFRRSKQAVDACVAKTETQMRDIKSKDLPPAAYYSQFCS